MKTSSALLWLATSSAFAAIIEQRAACNQDNCLRAVNKPSSLAMRSSDCSSFLAPATVTISTIPASTVTITSYSIYGQAPATTDSVPAYASACSGSVRYSSACSCLGITQTTITTQIATATPAAVTVTTTVVVCSPDNNYGLLYSGGSYVPPAGTEANSSYFPSYFASTAQSCCAACYTTRACLFYDFSGTYCTLFVYDDGTITNPSNTLCPYGQGAIQFTGQNGAGQGPCSNYCPPGMDIYDCVTPT